MDSTTSNKRIAKNTVMLYVRMLLLMLVTLYTSRVVLMELGVEDFGLYSIVGSVVIFLGFINNSMTGATQRFLSYYQGKGDKEVLNVVFNSVKSELSESDTIGITARNLTRARTIAEIACRFCISENDVSKITILVRHHDRHDAGTDA